VKKDLWALGLLAALSAVMFGFLLGHESLYDWDEAWYGQVVKELLATGDWITLRWRGEPFFDKPPLALWAMAAAASAFGLNETALRLPSALASGLTVLVLYGIARLGFGRIRPALLSALVLLTTLPFVKAGRMAMLDGPLTLAFSLGVFCFLMARRDARWSVGLGLALALTWMIKGPLALLLLLVLSAYALWEREARVWRSPWFLAGLLAGLALVLPWYVLEWQRHGMAFVSSHFGNHVVGRALSTMDQHTGGPWFYLAHVAALDHPWFFALLPAGFAAWRHRRELMRPTLSPDGHSRKLSGDDVAMLRLALCWGLGVLGAFSLAATKLPWYVVPAYPAIALLIGGFLDRVMADPRPARALGWAWLLLGLAGAGYGGVLVSAPPPDQGYALAALLLGLGLLVGGAMLAWGRPASLWVVVGTTYLTLLALIPASLRWEARFAADLRPLAGASRAQVAETMGILYPSEATRPAFIYYLDRHEALVSRESLPERWETNPAALLTETDWQAMAGRLPGARVAASASGVLLLTR
jgi:4-amino-4-deoxy-L-arabinose transferase-like glycosyltransferase